MSEELKQAISALQCAKRGHCDHAMADEAIAALEALTQRPAAQAGEAFESVLIDGVAYDLQAPVAAELLRLHLELQALPTQLAQNDAFFVLDDEAKAMIVNSHHYTPENIRALIEQLKSFADPTKTNQADWDNLDWRGFCNVLWRVMMGLSCDLPTQPAAQEMPDAVEHYGTVDDLPAAQATPEPVGEALQFPPMPEGWPARFRCDSCDGNGEIGELVSSGHFQPPERQTCPDCGGRGWTSEEHAFNADHMREFAEAHALLTRPAPGVPEGFALVPVEPTLEMWQSVNQFAHAGSVWESMLAAAQAKGADK